MCGTKERKSDFMEQKTTDLMLKLMHSAVSGEALSADMRETCTKEEMSRALRLAAHHDLAHLVAWGAKKNGLAVMLGADGEAYIMKAVYRYQQIKYEYDRLCTSLEKAEIPFIPLKGAIMRKYYPEPWMRTSCDIDILIHNEDIEKAKKVLMQDLSYKYESTYTHDVSFFSPANVHIEIHFDLIEEGIVNASTKVLRDVWNLSFAKDGCTYWSEIPDDLFYFYHIAHMAKHVLNGGCGIKPFIDLLILDNMEGADVKSREEMLRRGELLKFTEVARRLSLVWFGTEKHDELTEKTETYVLGAGVYGSAENIMVLQRYRKGGKLKYVMTLVFPPYETMKQLYPILQKHRWLTPFAHVRRVLGKLFYRSKMKRAKKILAQNNSISDEQVESTYRFLLEVGLS